MSDKKPNFLKRFLKPEEYVQPLMLAGIICMAAMQTYFFGRDSISLAEWIVSIVFFAGVFWLWARKNEKGEENGSSS